MAIDPILKQEAANLPAIDLSPSQCDELELLLSGALLPWTGYGVKASGEVSADEAPIRLHPGTAPSPTPHTLRDPEGALLAVCAISKVEPTEKGAEVFGTLTPLEPPTHFDFRELRKTPTASKSVVREKGWAATNALFLSSLPTSEQLDYLRHQLSERPAGGILAFVSKCGQTRADFALVRGIQKALTTLSEERIVLILLPAEASPAAQTLIAHNYGATAILTLPTATAPASYPSNLLQEARLANPTNADKGFTVFFTGLSGSGKSTVARALQAKLLEIGPREVTLLDGDLVRKNLSSELGFSKEHRNLNILRIGYVASEITRHGGAAICCPIAPYDSVRKAVRSSIEPMGGFILVAITTPLEVCEKRDRKGLYAKARAGIIKEFTGISDPYEAPQDAAIYINTAEISLEAATEAIVKLLRDSGYLPE